MSYTTRRCATHGRPYLDCGCLAASRSEAEEAQSASHIEKSAFIQTFEDQRRQIEEQRQEVERLKVRNAELEDGRVQRLFTIEELTGSLTAKDREIAALRERLEEAGCVCASRCGNVRTVQPVRQAALV